MLRTRSISCCAIAAISATGLAGLALTGCTNSLAAASASAAPEQQAIVVDSVPTAEEAGLYVAQDEGYFRQQGLTVRIRSVTDGGAAIPDLQAGQAQFVGGNYVSFVLAQIAGNFNGTPAR